MEDNAYGLQDQYQTILTELDTGYGLLYQQAVAIQNEFWDNYWAGNSRVDWKDRSVLGVRARRRGNGSFEIQWFYNLWGKTREGESVPLSQYIRQSKNGGYTKHALLKHARDWEADVVLDVEARLAPIRAAAKDNRAIRRRIERTLVKLFPEAAEHDETTDDDAVTP